jgi:uncharacterized protein YecT (DUF1311 family)
MQRWPSVAEAAIVEGMSAPGKHLPSSRAWPLRAGIVLVGLGAGPAWAQDACEGAVTQAELNDCSHAAYLAADEDLNLAYEAALEAARQIDTWSEARAEDRLRVAQRAWVAYRDAACEAETAQEEGGSIHPLLRASCLERLTILRTEDLWAYAEQ